jgi:exodeoxyribonuclease-3
MHRYWDKLYHIVYCCASADFINKLNWVQVGNYDEWIADSDHMPLCVEFGV